MRRKATLQTLPQEEMPPAQATATEEQETPQPVFEQPACDDVGVSSDDNPADAAPAEPVGLPEQSLFSSLATALNDDRSAFLQVLDRAVDGAVAPAAKQALSNEADDPSDESAAFQKIVIALVAGRSPLTAVVVGSALAARTVARALFQPEGEFDSAAAEALLLAWLDAARALLKLRGADGLLRLLPAARNLARRAAGHRDVAPVIADAMRRVAARIADAEHAPEQAARRVPQRRDDERTAHVAFDLPRRIVIRGQMQLIFHAR
jgi:hypothetical protein